MRSDQFSLLSELGDGGQIARVAHVGGLVPALKACMQRTLAAVTPSLSRAQLVDRMNEIASMNGVKITTGRTRLLTTNILDKWLAPHDTDDVPPIAALEVFMLAVNSFEPLNVLAEFNGCTLLAREEVPFYEYGKATFENKERTKRLRKLENDLADSRKRTGR